MQAAGRSRIRLHLDQQIAKLLPIDSAQGDGFGRTVTLNGTAAMVGAYRDDNGTDSGSAYLFDFSPCESCARNPQWICDGDVDGDGQVNPVDSGLVQAAFGSTDDRDLCRYDMDCDGQINPVDSGIVQSLFGTCNERRPPCE